MEKPLAEKEGWQGCGPLVMVKEGNAVFRAQPALRLHVSSKVLFQSCPHQQIFSSLLSLSLSFLLSFGSCLANHKFL